MTLLSPGFRRAAFGVGAGILAAVWIFCSLQIRAWGADVETDELRVAVETLRRENAELRRLEAVHQRELAVLGGRLRKGEAQHGDMRNGLVADDEENRGASEWKHYLLNALKTLAEADREAQNLRNRLHLLLYASQETLKSAGQVDPAKRALLEGELRETNKLLSEKEEVRPKAMVPQADTSALSAAKVIGAELDLGVAAIDVGRKHGARVGMPFLVTRGKAVMAVLTLAEVRETTALALIEQMEPGKPIQKGDSAVLRKL